MGGMCKELLQRYTAHFHFSKKKILLPGMQCCKCMTDSDKKSFIVFGCSTKAANMIYKNLQSCCQAPIFTTSLFFNKNHPYET